MFLQSSSHPNEVRCKPTVGLTCFSLMTSKVEHPFTCLWSPLHLLWRNAYSRPLTTFEQHLFLRMSCMRPVCIPYINPYLMRFASVFIHPGGHPPTLGQCPSHGLPALYICLPSAHTQVFALELGSPVACERQTPAFCFVKISFILSVWVFCHVGLSVPHRCLLLSEVRRGIRSPGTRVTHSCAL